MQGNGYGQGGYGGQPPYGGQPMPGGYMHGSPMPGSPMPGGPMIGFGGYPPSANAGLPPAQQHMDPQVSAWFQAVDKDGSGQISAFELQQALASANYSHFNHEACRLMISMFDRNNSGRIDVNEFQQLWTHINQWKGAFQQFDSNRSGAIESNELRQAFGALGYNVSPQFCQMACAKFDIQSRRQLTLDNFIQACVSMKLLTETFRRKDMNTSGTIQISYEEFLHMAMWSQP